jgi:hypothetical protein
VDLGEWLGYERPVNIRTLIKENLREIEAIEVCGVAPQTSSPQGGRPGTEYWLTEEQAIAVCQLAGTARAASVQTWRFGGDASKLRRSPRGPGSTGAASKLAARAPHVPRGRAVAPGR